MDTQTLSISFMSEGITRLLVIGPHLKGKQMFFKCDCRCLLLPCSETATVTNSTVTMSFSVNSGPGDGWVNGPSF